MRVDKTMNTHRKGGPGTLVGIGIPCRRLRTRKLDRESCNRFAVELASRVGVDREVDRPAVDVYSPCLIQCAVVGKTRSTYPSLYHSSCTWGRIETNERSSTGCIPYEWNRRD